MSNPYDRNRYDDRNRYGSPGPDRARSPQWDRVRDEDPNEERNMWQSREEDGGWRRERDEEGARDGARNDSGANRFERGNERRYPDAAYGLNARTGQAGDSSQDRYERGNSFDPERDYAHGFGPNHGFGYPRRGRDDRGPDYHRGYGYGFGPAGYGASGVAPVQGSSYSPTGLDRDRLRSRGEQGYGREFGGYAGRGPKGYKRTDSRIREDVCERLSRDDEVDASEISVRVESGEVTLEGSVETRRQKHRAEELAADVLGVDDVHNLVRVNKSLLGELKDKLTGDEPLPGGHAGSGTKTTAPTSSRSSDHNRH